jgi:hypothetical protein
MLPAPVRWWCNLAGWTRKHFPPPQEGRVDLMRPGPDPPDGVDESAVSRAGARGSKKRRHRLDCQSAVRRKRIAPISCLTSRSRTAEVQLTSSCGICGGPRGPRQWRSPWSGGRRPPLALSHRLPTGVGRPSGHSRPRVERGPRRSRPGRERDGTRYPEGVVPPLIWRRAGEVGGVGDASVEDGRRDGKGR